MALAQLDWIGNGGGGVTINGIESLAISYQYAKACNSYLLKKDGTLVSASAGDIRQGSILKFTNRSSSGFKYTLTALAPCYVKGIIKLGNTTVGTFDGDYPIGDIQVYNSSDTDSLMTAVIVAIET